VSSADTNARRPSPGRHPRRRVPFAPLALASLVVAATLAPEPRPGSPLDLEVTAVPLDPVDATRQSVGPLRFRGGLWLRSADTRFGGLSDLVVDEGGLNLVAVSDCGRAFLGRLSYAAGGNLVGLAGARLVDLAGPGGRRLERGETDAEALARADDGLLVGFEGRPCRVWRYGARGLFQAPQPVPVPGLEQCRGNRGLESIASLDDGRLMLVCEGSGLRPGSTSALVGRGPSWITRSYPLDGGTATVGDVYRPTAARRLPRGDVLVLERRYPPLGARLRVLSRASLDGSGPLEPRELVVLEPPLTLDNMEGLEIRRAGGELLVYLLSDDNGCAKTSTVVATGLQRTLLLMFALDEAAVAAPPSS